MVRGSRYSAHAVALRERVLSLDDAPKVAGLLAAKEE
jgi:hypothetical protein